jgi:hypothetical protein
MAEVADALEQAERLLERLNLGDQHAVAKANLELRIVAAKAELELLRTSRPERGESGPRRIDFPPWEQPERSGV